MTRVCLVRHGQTDWNLEGRYQGQSDVELNNSGKAQAQKLKDILAGSTFNAVYASDLSRAVETARVIAEPRSLEVNIEARLREINQGEWEGLLVTTIKQHYEKLWHQRFGNPADVRPPGGETVEEVARRVYAALDDITAQYPHGSVLVVSHGLSIATVICKKEHIPVGLAYQRIPENAEPVWVTWPVEN
jgi:broad specificity phosphatase PhoE